MSRNDEKKHLTSASFYCEVCHITKEKKIMKIEEIIEKDKVREVREDFYNGKMCIRDRPQIEERPTI